MGAMNDEFLVGFDIWQGLRKILKTKNLLRQANHLKMEKNDLPTCLYTLFGEKKQAASDHGMTLLMH